MSAAKSDRHAHANAVRTSQVFSELAEVLDGDRITVSEILERLEGRGLGVVLLVLSLPMCIPNIPGISTLFGLLLIAPAIQLITGGDRVWLPGFVRHWTFGGDGLRKAFTTCAKLLAKLEYLARPRFSALTRRPATLLIGIQTLALALILILPMPGANIIPGIAIVLTGMAILQKDGLLMLASIPVAFGAYAWVYFGSQYVIDFCLWVWRSSETWLSRIL